MTSLRHFSISSTYPERQNSITANDIPHHAQVEAHVAEQAANATRHEISMTLVQGLKTYPKAVAWSVLLSTCIIMEGYDIVLISNLMAVPSFQERFGDQQHDGRYQLSAAWQSGLSSGALVGEILGLFFIGVIVERLGYRKTMLCALGLLTSLIFIVFFAPSLPVLLVGEILMGIPWGAFQTLTTTYAAEVCPIALRAYLTTYVNLCWVIGQFIASAVLKGVFDRPGPIAYRLPFALQWIWPVPLMIAIYCGAPESPWWLIRKARYEAAQQQLLKLTSTGQPDFDPGEIISMMIYTNELEKASTAGARYRDCFMGIDRRRTEIVCMVWAIQTLCGSQAFTGYSTYFFEQAGLDAAAAFSLSLGQYALAIIGTLLSWFLMIRYGRRTLYLWGQVATASILFIVGFLGVAHETVGVQWAIGALILVYTFIYDMTIGPVCYSLVAEISSTRLRNKTVVLARNLYNITGLVSFVLTPHMLNPMAWGWGARTGFFWAGIGSLCAIWTFFRLPEPKGRSYAEMDMLFNAGVPARKFRETDVMAFGIATGSSREEGHVPEKPICVVEAVESRDTET